MVAVLATFTAQAITTGATVNGVKPTGLANGDLLIAFCWSNSTTSTWSATGFTARSTTSSTGSVILSRIVDGTEASPIVFTRAVSTVGLAGVILVRVTGAGNIADAVTAATSGTTPSIPSVNSVAPSSYLLQLLSRGVTGADAWTAPGTATKRFDTNSTGTVVACAGGDEFVGSGATGARGWTHTGTSAVRSGMVVITPAGYVPSTQVSVRVAGATTAATEYVRIGGVATPLTQKVCVGGVPV